MVLNITLKDDGAHSYDYGIEYETDAELAAVPLFHDYPEPLLNFASACCVIFMLIGIPGNLTTIIALARYKKVQNATSVFIINLHVSDLIFGCIILPMSAMTFTQKHWTHGLIMCRVFALIKYVLHATCLSTILAISINRYVMVCHPLLYPRLYNRINLSIMILALWLSSFTLFLPSTFGVWGRYDLEQQGGFCRMLNDKHNRSPRKLFLITAFIGLFLTTGLCYTQIWWVVRKSTMIQKAKKDPQNRATQSNAANKGNGFSSFLAPSSSGNSVTDDDRSSNTILRADSNAPATPNDIKSMKHFKATFSVTKNYVRPKGPTSRDKKLCSMIIAIMISSVISHLSSILTIILAYKGNNSEPVIYILAYMLMYSGSCMNPIIYVLMSKEYRQAYKSLYDSVINKIK